MRTPIVCILLASSIAATAEEVTIRSSKDGAAQMALFDVPAAAARGAKGRGVPLLVLLHSWSSNYKSSESTREAQLEAEKRGWIFLAPDFRGPNNRPQACASDLAVQDVIDAVRYARSHASVDARRIYLLGGSGGGHMALMMAGRVPKLWRAVSAWVPISDLAEWHASTKAAGLGYAAMVEKCCGGPPGAPGTADEYRKRSPVSWLGKAKKVPIDIETGIHDGHNKASVPVRQSLIAFNRLAQANGVPRTALSEADIATITAEERIPGSLAKEKVEEAGRKRPILFRRSAGPARITIFDGAHETDFTTAIRWLESHR